MVWVKTPLLVCAVLLLAAFGLQATPAPCSLATNYAQLDALGTCQLGDKVYSDFLFASTNVNFVSVPENQVAILSESSTMNANGFLFSLPMDAGALETQDVTLAYTVTDVGPLSQITSVEVPVFVGSAVGVGSTASLDETVIGPNKVGLGTLHLDPSTTSASLTFPGVTSVTIFKDLAVSGGALPGTSGHISVFADYVDQTGVPEPGFYGVLAGGLAGCFMLAKRRKKTV